MAIRTLLKYRNADRTKDLNDRYVDLFTPGVFDGGEILPVPALLKIDLTPWKLVSIDGMVVEETAAVVRLDTLAGQTTVIAVKAVYSDNNVPTVTTVAIELSAFNLLPDVAYYVVMGHVEVPLAATQVLSSYINYTPRDILDKLGRSFFRGIVSSAGLLPPAGNRVGDLYVVVDGIGGPPNLWGWDGTAWIEMTDFIQLSADLSAHRANLFVNEKHLTDDEKLAVVGTSGNPVNAGNKLVDSSDPRLPTIFEKQALAGSDGSPSSSNRYVTEAFTYALTDEKALAIVPVGSVPLTIPEGPFYVGNSGLGSANQYFSFYHYTEAREFSTAAGLIVKCNGVFKDAGLTMELDPSTDPSVDAKGFFTSNPLWIRFDNTPDTSFRLLYGRRFLLGTFPQNSLLRRSINDAQTSAQTVTVIEAIKGRPFTTVPPVKEQNIRLRQDMVSVKEYLSTVFRADHVVSDFSRVKAAPDFAADFVENVGIPANETFSNVSLVGFTYNSVTGIVTYSAAVALGSVTAGNVFLDGALDEYKVTVIGVNAVTIVNRDGSIPGSINTTVTLNTHGSIKPDNNPRQINLSIFDVLAGKERVAVREVEYVENEFHPVTGNVAFEIRSPLTSAFLKEPRVRFYGGFFNKYVGVQKRVICNNIGRILITGFFTDLHLLAHLASDSPSITVYVDGATVGVTQDLSRAGDVVSYGTDIDIQQKTVVIANGLQDLVPHTVEITINNASGDFIIYGFDVIRRDLTSVAVLPGRAFVQSDIVKNDAIITYANSSVIPQGRGAVSTRYIDRVLNQVTQTTAMTDFDGTAGTPAGTAVAAVNVFTVTSGLTKLGFFKAGDIVLLVTATSSEVLEIFSIGPAPGLVTFTTLVAGSGAAILIHLASTTGASYDPIREYARFYMDELGIEQTNDFTLVNPLLTDRTYTVEDGCTSIAGKQLLYVTTGIDGIDRALKFDSALSTLRIRALCSRMDLLVANNSAMTMFYRIDGSPQRSKSITGVGLTLIPLLTNARYQSHEVFIENSSGLTVAGLILHEPAHASVLEGSLLGSQNYLARYAVSATLTGDQLPIGGVALDPYVVDGVYVDGLGIGTPWAYTQDFTESPTFGRYLRTSQEGAYFEFTFYGEGFEFGYSAGSDRGIALVSLNGIVANSVNFPVNFRGMDSPTGTVDMYDALVTRKRFGISSLPTAKYVVKVQVQSPRDQNVSSTDFALNITDVYLVNTNGFLAVTPKRSVRDGYLYGEDQCRDERNFDSGAFITETVPVVRTVLSNARAGSEALLAGTTSVTINFSLPVIPPPYTVTANLRNSMDPSPFFQPVTIRAETNSTFTASWNVPLDTANYSLNWILSTFL